MNSRPPLPFILPRLADGYRWYVVAGNVEGLVVLRLEGRAGPQVEQEVNLDTRTCGSAC